MTNRESIETSDNREFARFLASVAGYPGNKEEVDFWEHWLKEEKPQKGHGRKFEEIVVEYPPAELCTYPEYRGKPYFSIKYEENGEHIIGFGTYKQEILSRYLREYFIVSMIIGADKREREET